jgi:hypothetical protein
MKARDFSSILGTFSEVLNAAGAPIAGNQIKTFAAIFDAHPTSTVSELTKRIDSSLEPGPTGSPSVGDVARLLSALKNLLDKTAKTAVMTDVETIEKVLRARPSMGLTAFVQTAIEVCAVPSRTAKKRTVPLVRDDLVLQYKEKLEASLGDAEKFTATYNDLRSNAAIGKSEIVALAKQMTGSGARTEEAALKKIWSRHQSLMVVKAKSRSTGGRSAA